MPDSDSPYRAHATAPASAIGGAVSASGSVDGRHAVSDYLLGLGELGGSPGLLEQVDPQALLDLGDSLLAASSSEDFPGGAPFPPSPEGTESPAIQEALGLWLDATRRSAFLRRIADGPQGKRWLELVLQACERTHYTVGELFRRRVARNRDRTWLRLLGTDRITEISLGEVEQRVEGFARGLHSLWPGVPQGQPVAILSENSLEGMIADLACLTSGIVDTIIPADATGDQAAYILEQTEAAVLVLGDRRQLEKMVPLLARLPGVSWVVQLRQGDEAQAGFGAAPEAGPRLLGHARHISPAELTARGRDFPGEEFRRRRDRVRFGDAATLMYTSGTTGLPKGILFTHRNLVYKRFARALALPGIGEEDHFLCYLPLFHTFGRWLEMLGTLFWSATYTFMENPSLEVMLDNLRRARPTVFISIPKKWIQLRERIAQDVFEETDEHGVRASVETITGGRLRWGLSAAGYLDPAVFRFFQRHGVELLSGFGMTEGTGGITMTPPGRYREGSVGPALPGIEICRAEDGELLVRGPYVMEGYFGPDEATVDYRKEWFHTGDIVSLDEDGFVAIVDRKKDIYKNVKGQTVAPQRVESLFQSFGEVRQVFLVGDGREYNTLLIYPNYDYEPPSLREMTPEALREYLSNIVVSVNGFLAPFERVLDFALLPRALSLEEEELTPKATYRRKVVEQHFTDSIEAMYQSRSSRLQLGDLEARLPHWWLREMGLTLRDVVVGRGGLQLPRLSRSLSLEAVAGDRVRVGDLLYQGAAGVVDLEMILSTPELWVGNLELIRFAGPAGIRRPRIRQVDTGEFALSVAGIAGRPLVPPLDRQRLEDALWREDRSLFTIHLAAAALLTSEEKDGLRLIAYLEMLTGEDDSLRAGLARIALRRAILQPRAELRSAAFRALLPQGAPEMVGPTILSFLAVDPGVFNPAGAKALTRRGLREEVMAAFVQFLSQVHLARDLERRTRQDSSLALDEHRTSALLRFLITYAAEHPAWFKAARSELTRWTLSSETPRLREAARRGLEKMTAAFRAWLGPDPKVAVDPVSGREYGWKQVLRFDPGFDPEDRARLERAVATAPLVKEAIFILSGGARVSLAEIPPGGVRVRHLGSGHGKVVCRLTVETRNSGTFEIAVNLSRGEPAEMLESEVLWLTRLSSPEGGRYLVEEIGGYWPEHGLWTEEYVPGETVSALLARVSAQDAAEGSDRLSSLWLHLAASATVAYMEFWHRTERALVPGDPSPHNLIVPAHDYQEGSRLISISERRPFSGLPPFLRSLKEGLLDAVAASFPSLAGLAGCETLYAAVVDVFGEEEGTRVLEEMTAEPAAFESELPGEAEPLRAFLDQVRAGGYMPRRLSAAIRRYQRWAAANQDATPAARARTLAELWDSYGLRTLEEGRPETRLRLFRETVFAHVGEELRGELARLIHLARSGLLTFELLLREMSEIAHRFPLNEDETYFLARLTYAHLRPTDTADLALVDHGGTRVTDLVVTLRDQAGRYFRVRHASNPREVWALHSLFQGAGIRIHFRPGHQFLVAVEQAGKVLGGLVYRPSGPGVVHMEKIVVTPSHRRQGISEGLMEDFFRRLRERGVRAVTTGFFRPQYFRRFRFQVDREHAGLVRILEEEETAALRPPGA